MKILAEQIKRELEIESALSGHCAIYEKELQRVWPLDVRNREKQIAQFAEDHALHLRFYWQGLCAIFEHKPAE